MCYVLIAGGVVPPTFLDALTERGITAVIPPNAIVEAMRALTCWPIVGDERFGELCPPAAGFRKS